MTEATDSGTTRKVYLTKESRRNKDDESSIPPVDVELPDDVMILQAGEIVGEGGEVIGYLDPAEMDPTQMTDEELQERIQESE